MIEKLTGKIQELTKWFTSLSPAQQETILKVGLVVAAIGPLSIGFGKVAKGISFQNILCYCLTLFIKSSVTSLPISKHPMLLFNLFAGFKKKKPKKFQNILCYCLTAACARRAAGRAISKHPMLLFNTNDCVVERHEF